MPGAPKGNKNAWKHGLRAAKREIVAVDSPEVRKITFTIRRLEESIDVICARMAEAQGDEFTKLANALSGATTALFNGHRTMSYLTGGMTPLEDALKELSTLDFGED